MEALARLLDEHRDRKMAVVMLPVDPNVSARDMEAIIRRDFNFPGVDRFAWCLDPAGTTVLKLDPMGIGGTVIIDRQGRIAFQGRMAHSYEELKAEIERVL